jgi:peptide deformylase
MDQSPLNATQLEDPVKKKLAATGLNPIFNEQTPKADFILCLTDEIQDLITDLVFFAENNTYLRLAGLAANQLAKDKERVNFQISLVREEGNSGEFIVAINPEIVKLAGTSFDHDEGCLTWPGKRIKAVRHDVVVVKYKNRLWESKEIIVSGFPAIVWQHELNHLLGIPEIVIGGESKQEPNEHCACNSGRKFKKCCGRYVGRS